ncbi:hypothetical protein ATI45_2033 [Marinobacter sp. LV10MA510-1]|nr:hypothetical protein ATI45_2033 [Marinobacter sp. LV10MA510-1]PFG51573.1 hypothetical protein ATG98_0525 [Marinobacter sp. LV10R520-4]
MGLILSGAFIVMFIMVDVVWTTLTTHGGGPMTTLLTRGAKGLSSGVYRLFGTRLLTEGGSGLRLKGKIWRMSGGNNP